MTSIEKVIQESSSIRSLIFDDPISLGAEPGQFLMVWLPEIGEFPMSVSMSYGKRTSIVVKAMGEGSRRLFESAVGDLIGLRGPYGASFSLSRKFKRSLLVGGGTGIAPILKLAQRIRLTKTKPVNDPDVVMGARTRDELAFLPSLKKSLGSMKVHPSTDDGSVGFKGYAHELVRDLLRRKEFDSIFCCGPEMMMKRVYEIARESRIPAQFSLERVMKCGIGICGSCCIQDVVLCRDGPVVDSNTLQNLSKEFGNFERDKTGALARRR